MSTNEVRKIEVKGARKVRTFSMPIMVNILLLALGICLLIWADKVTSWISIGIGITFLVCAAYNFIAWYRVENRSMGDHTRLVSAIALAIAGAFLITNQNFLKDIISILVGIFLLVESIFRLQDTLNSKKYNPNYKNALILAVIGIVCGTLCVFGKIIIPNLIVQLLGVALIVFAFVDMAGGIIVQKSVKKAAKIVEAEIVNEE